VEKSDLEYSSSSTPLVAVYTVSDNEFQACEDTAPPKSIFGYQYPEGPHLESIRLRHRLQSNNRLEPIVSSTFEAQTAEVKTMVLSNSQTVLAPKETQEGEELCMFSKHDSTIILRNIDPGEWMLIRNALTLTSEEKKREDLRKS
jgi:hypothetical protein